jgi:hypothetical protein
VLQGEEVRHFRGFWGRRSSRFVCNRAESEVQIFLVVSIPVLRFHCIKREKGKDEKIHLALKSFAYVQ